MSRKFVSSKPFLTWAGGKNWLTESNIAIRPGSYKRYIEPFLGGGAVFFSLPITPYIISDSNPELINCYKVIKANWAELSFKLQEHHRNHSKTYYYRIRQSKPRLPVTRAAKFIYLNRTCWNGLYRVNLKGEFNVPIGTKRTVVRDENEFESISKRLKGGRILSQDFEKTINKSEEGDFLFVDPPYTVKHNQNGFLKYNEKIFTWDDQMRLKDAILQAVDRGVRVTMTNADHASIRKLYKGTCEIERVQRRSVIASKAEHRGAYGEVVLRFGWNK